MEHHYGYIRRSEGSDGDQIDVFLGPDAENETFPVYVVNQKNESGGFDEHKVMVGFRTMLQAGEAYLSNYADDWLQRQGGALDVVEMSLPEFKTWLVESDTKKPVPSGFNEPEVTPEIEQPEVTVKPEISTNEPISEPTLQVEPTAAPEEPATSTPEPTLPLEEPADVSRETPNLVDEFTRRFQAGERFPSIADARKVAGTITGEKIEPGTPRAKAIDEAVEEAVVRTARDIVQKGETPDQTYDDLVDLYNRQPRFGTRTSTSVQQQAYSTPVPIAYVASQLGGINSETTVYEPTAGHGALLLEADTGNVSANELNDSRADSLERQDYTVTREDATTRTSRTVDVVIANPPFGAVDEGGTSKRWQPDPDNPAYSTTQIDHAIALKALESMKDDGRAVLILGSVKKTAIDERARSDAYHGKAKREFFLTLYGKYNVVDHFTISGGLYSKQGAGWPIDVIVIEGRGKSNLRLPAADVPPILRSFDELKEKLDGRRPVHPAERPDVPESSSRPSAEQDEGAGGVRSPGSTERPDTRPSGEGEGPSGGIRLPGGDVQPSEPVGQPAETGESDGVRDGSDTGEPGVGGTDNEPDLERRGGDSERGLESAPQPERGGDSGGGRSEGLGGQPDVLGQGGLTEQLENVTEADLDALINEVLAEGTPTPAEPDVPVEAQESAPVAESPPSAEESAKAAGKEVKAAVSEALDAIWEATGANRPGTLHSGPFAFGEEEYVRIVEHLKKALEHTVQAGKHLKDFIQAVFADVSRFPQDWVTNVLTPAVKQFVSEVQAGQIRIAGITVRQTRDPIDTSQSQVPYEPRSANTAVGTFVPANMRDAIDTALAKVEDKFGSVDQFIAEKLGYKLDEVQHHFSAEQVDAIAIAIANFDRGAAFIIGDQTGVGKGRVVAAMIRFGLRNGKIPIFVTEKPDLYADMHRDLKDIGMPDLSILATNSGLNLPLELADNGKVTKRLKNPKNELWNPILRDLANEANIGDYDVVFTTYTQMQTIEGDRTTRMDFMDAVGPGAMVILDESHNAGGTEKPQQQKEGKKEKLTRAKFVRDMVARAWNVLYSSATYAKRPSVMDLYYRTDMSLAVNSPEDLAPMIQKGGIPMQQVIATMLAKAGQYIRRERTFDGVIYDTVDAKTDIQSYEGFSKGLREIQNFSERYVADARDNIDDEVKGAGQAISADGSTGGAGATSLNFTSVMHNLVNQFLLSSKVNASVEEAIRALQNKENPGQVVITAANTMESFLKDEMKRLDLKTGDAYSPNFNDLLLRYLRRTREITIKQPFQKKGEKGEKHYLTDTELGEAGVAFYRKTEKMLRNLDFGDLSTSPFDEMRARLEAAGHTMGEITGRKHQLVKNETDTWTIRGRRHTPKTKRETIIGYQNGETDVLLINQSGSTGISLHASALNPEKGRRKRTMIIAQAEGNIDTHMQILGRVHRTGQVSTPDYIQLVADVPAERRPAAALAKKMASLNANTTGSRKGSMKTGDVLDFLNQYGDEVVASILDEDREINRKLAIALKEDEDGELIRDDAARLVSGRIPLLPVKEQEALYQMIETSYREYIDQLNETGQNTLEATVEDLDAILISREQVVDRIANIDSPFAEGAELEHMDVKITRKPHPTEKVLADLAKNIGTSVDGMSGDNVDKLKALNKLARDWMNDQSKEALDAFEDYKRGVLDDISDVDETSMDMDALESLREKNADRRKAQDVRLQEVRAQFLSRLRAVELGLPVTLATDEEVNPAIAVNITHTKGTANPLALSTWKVTFYLARGGQITVPLSRINSKVLVTPSPRGIAYGSTATIDAFDHLGKGREKRHIVTGNLPAGYDYVKGKGRIINFTDHQGRLRQGILMAKDFDPVKFADSKPINLNEADHVVTFVKKNGRPWTNDNAVMVRERIGGELRFSVERSKRVGGRYYLNQHVLDAAGKDFTSVGDNMRLDVDEATGKRVIQAMIDVGAQFEARDNRDTAKAVTEEVRHSRGAKPTGQTVESIQGTLEQELGKRPIARLLEGGRVKIVQSDAHLPESVQHRDGGVRGAYDETTDTTYLVADNIERENAMGVLLHELGVHYGLKKMLGAKLYDSVMGELRRMARTPEVAEARSRVPDDVSSKWIDEETLGYLVESRANHKLSPVKKMFAAIRAFLFRMGFTKKLDVDALVAMAQASVRRSSRGMRIQRRPSDFIPTALATSPMFSRKAAQDIDDPDLARLVDAASGPDKSRNWRKLLNGWRDRVRQSLFDPFHGLKIAERVGAGLDPIMHTLQSSYVAARMSTSTDTQLWVTLVKGALRWQNNVATFDPDSKGLLDILQPVEDKLNLWKAYMVAKRASRLKKEGRERLITPEMIAAGLALAERHPEFLTVSQEWADFNSRMLDFAEEAGVIDGSMRSLWEHDDYIPFYRVLEGEVGNPTSGQGLSHQQTIKRLKGGTAALNDVFENMLMNTAWLIQASMKNHAMQMAIENLEDSGLVRKAPMTWNKSLIPMSEIKRLAKQDTGPLADMRLALEDMGSELTDLEWEGFQKLWSMEVPKGDDVVMVRKNGKPVWYNVDESAPLLLRALTAMNQEAFGDWIKTLRLPKQWLTGFVTADPAFMLANWVRDTGAAFVLSRDGTKPLVSGIRGAIKTLKRDDDYWHMMAAAIKTLKRRLQVRVRVRPGPRSIGQDGSQGDAPQGLPHDDHR